LKGVHEGRTGIHERVVTNETHDDGRDENVQCRTRHGADDRRPKDIRTWVLHALSRDGGRFNTNEREECHAGRDTDAVVKTATGGVEGSKVGLRDKKPADDTHEEQRQDFKTTVTFWNQAI